MIKLKHLTENSLYDIQESRARLKLINFVQYAWPITDPSIYHHNWHLEVICEHLEAVYRGEIKRLIINVPRRHTKSLVLNVFFPAWVWIQDPKRSFLFTAYGQSLTIRDAGKCRDLVESYWYQKQWGAKVALKPGQTMKSRFENTAGGYRFTTSIGSGTLGEGADIIGIDDPHNTTSTYLSEAERVAPIGYYGTTLAHCLNNPKTGAIVAIMQRLHTMDFTGHLLSFQDENWELLRIPMHYEKSYFLPTSLDWRDPRTEEGELLFPGRFTKQEVQSREEKLGTYGTAGQMQQRPVDKGGNTVKEEWFEDRYKTEQIENKEFKKIVQSWDTAQKEGELNDYSVCSTWGLTKNRYYLINVFQKKLKAPELNRAAKNLASKYKPNMILIEDKASGTGLIQHLQAETTERVKAINPKGDKLLRLENETPAMEAGKVILPEEAVWLFDFETELFSFPASEHDDQVDSVSQFLMWARTSQRRVYFA